MGIQEDDGRLNACHAAGPASLNRNEKLHTRLAIQHYKMIPRMQQELPESAFTFWNTAIFHGVA